MKTRFSLWICTGVFAFCLSGCTGAFFEEALRDSRAREHGGDAFKPTFNAQGAYTGYTQKVGKDTYYHAPNGRIIGVRRYDPRDDAKWVEHRDSQGRLIKKTLDGHLKAGVVYHYSQSGEVLGTTTWSYSPDGAFYINGRKHEQQEPLGAIEEIEARVRDLL